MKYLVTLFVIMFAALCSASAAVPALHAHLLSVPFLGTIDATLTGMIDDLTTLFGDVKTFVIAVVVFSLGVWLVLKVRRR